MQILIPLYKIFNAQAIARMEQKHGVEYLGDLEINLDLDTDEGAVGYYDCAPNSEWSSHCTKNVYGEIPHAVSVSIPDEEIEAKPDLVKEITETIEEMVKLKDEALIEYINE
jgi:hypothetical protein